VGKAAGREASGDVPTINRRNEDGGHGAKLRLCPPYVRPTDDGVSITSRLG